VEGQASWLMIAYELKQSGQKPDPTPDILKSVADSSETSIAEYPVLKNSPLYIQQSLLFPYSEGILFFDAVYRKMGKAAFSAVFKDPPVDSAQIMHPDLYYEHEKPAHPSLPRVTVRNEGKELSEGSLGEFDHLMLLKQYIGADKSKQLSPHLRGGEFKIMSVGKDHLPMLEYASQWDSAKDAAEFFTAYQKVLETKWIRCDASTKSANVFAGIGDNGYFVTRLDGNVVSSVEGIGDESEWQRLKNDAGN
jgi:hypothetical protein